MKYKYKRNQYKINLLYTDDEPYLYNLSERKLFNKIFSNNKEYSALGNGIFVTAQAIHKNLVYYRHIYVGFLLSYIWIKNVIDNMKDCLLISNRLYFIEGLLVYTKIKKISIMPVCVDEHYEDQYNYFLEQFKNTYNKKIIIENNTIKNIYTNIVIYIGDIPLKPLKKRILTKNILTNTTIKNDH